MDAADRLVIEDALDELMDGDSGPTAESPADAIDRILRRSGMCIAKCEEETPKRDALMVREQLRNLVSGLGDYLKEALEPVKARSSFKDDPIKDAVSLEQVVKSIDDYIDEELTE